MTAPLFTFLDGAFRYDCAACGQQCCRGKGIAIDAARELRPLLSRAPAVAPFLEQLPGGYVRLPDVTDGCWFLADDGTQLNGWYLAHDKPAAVVLFAHGNAGNITHSAEMVQILHDRHRSLPG